MFARSGMKRLDFERASGPLEESIVEEFERLIGSRLPEDYRRFLLETNGGPPSSGNRRFAIADNPDFIPEFDEATVDHFHQLVGVSRPSLSLRQVFEITRGRIPAGTVPIATDDMGNLFLLGIVDPLRDTVFFWDHEAEGFERADDPFHNVGQLTDSFETFINALDEDE